MMSRMTKMMRNMREYSKTRKAPKLTPGRYELTLSLANRSVIF